MESVINFDLCVICQRKDGEELRNPKSDRNKSQVQATYKNFDEILAQYKEYNKLNRYKHLNVMSKWAEDFETFGAKWHKSCRLKFSKKDLQKLIHSTESPVTSSSNEPRQRKSSRPQNKPIENVCLFCNNESGAKDLHLCVTLELDQKIRGLCDNSPKYAFIKAKQSGRYGCDGS